MIFQELDIRSDFKDSSSVYEHVIFGTFRFDPIFFEEKILPIIKSKDATLPCIKKCLKYFSIFNFCIVLIILIIFLCLEYL